MILSRRERYIVFATVGALALLAADYFVVTPLWQKRSSLVAEVEAAEVELERASVTFSKDRRLKRRWAEMQDKGLASDAPSAESQTLNALRRWAQESRLSLSSLKPERGERHDPQFRRLTFRVTAVGSMQSISEYLWRVRTAEVPLRVTDLSITARKEGADDLTLQLGVSTIYLSPEPPPQDGRGGDHAGGNDAGGGGAGPR